MTAHARERREFLKAIAVGMGGLPFLASGHRPWTAYAATTAPYDPAAKFELTVTEVEYRRTTAERSLKARIYKPNGRGPFPTVLDLHGGAWNAKDRFAEEPMDSRAGCERSARGRGRPDARTGSTVTRRPCRTPTTPCVG